MALLNDITAITKQDIEPQMVDAFFKSSPGFALLRDKCYAKFAGGTFIQIPIAYAPLNGGPTGRGGTFDTSYVQTDTALTFNIKEYVVPMTLYGYDNMINVGENATLSNLEAKAANAAETMAYKMGTDMWLDAQGQFSSTLALDGLYAACNDGTNSSHGNAAVTTYGGIPRSALSTAQNTGINGYTKSFYGSSLNLSDIQTAIGASTFGSKRVDIIFTTQAVWDLIWNKIQPQQRFQSNGGGIGIAPIGFDALRFNSTPIVVDQYMPAGYMYGIASDFLQLATSIVPKYAFGTTGWKDAQNNDDVSCQYLFGGNMTYSASRISFQLTDVTS